MTKKNIISELEIAKQIYFAHEQNILKKMRELKTRDRNREQRLKELQASILTAKKNFSVHKAALIASLSRPIGSADIDQYVL